MSSPNKRRLSTPKKIIVGILIALAALILGVGGFMVIKLYGMSRGHIKTVQKPEVTEYKATPEPGVEIVTVDDSQLDLTQDYDDPIDPADVYSDPIYSENQIDPNVINILLLGDDGRDQYDSGRSDSMMILSYNQKLNTVKIISLLRDTWIYIPGREKWNRINTAYRFGGVGLAINTINTNFDLDIQYYMLVHFEDIKAITDTVGGIDLELTEREIEYINRGCDSANQLPLVEGVHHLNGIQTFYHCRNRSIGNGDWSRTQRQRSVLMAFYNRAKTEKSATSLTSLMFSLMDYCETNMTPGQMISLGTSIIFGKHSGMPETAAMPFKGTWHYAYQGSMAVIEINIEENRDAIHEFLYGNAD